MNTTRIASIARDYKNIPILNREIKAVIQLEDANDEEFWKPLLQQGGKKYRFVAGVPGSQNAPTGSAECFKFIPYLDHRLWIALDSDWRLLRNQAPLAGADYVLQTYTYAWENHQSEATHLQQRWRQIAVAVPTMFDFSDFLAQLSPLLYEPLALLVARQIKTKVLGKCLSIQPNNPKWVANNGQLIIEEIKKNLTSYIGNAIPSPQMLTTLQQHRITPQNAYLHVRGHNLYDLLKRIGQQLCHDSTIDFEERVLLSARPTPTYWQMAQLHSDIRRLQRLTP